MAHSPLPEAIKKQLLGKRIVITGGSGFLGSNLKLYLEQEGIPFIAPTRQEMNVKDSLSVSRVLQKNDYVIHLAARCGGIQVNMSEPRALFEENIAMGLTLFKVGTEKNIGKLLILGTVCEYPDNAAFPLKEEDIWNGLPNTDTGPYGMAKRMLLYQGVAFESTLPFEVTHLVPTNIYGPHDHFHPTKGHVIPGMIARMHNAKMRKDPTFPVWGNGQQTREFIHAADASRGIMLGLATHTGPQAINIGSGREIAIGKIAVLIKQYMGYAGDIVFDTNAPIGVKRRMLNTSRAEKILDFKSHIRLEDGLKETVEYFLQMQEAYENQLTLIG